MGSTHLPACRHLAVHTHTHTPGGPSRRLVGFMVGMLPHSIEFSRPLPGPCKQLFIHTHTHSRTGWVQHHEPCVGVMMRGCCAHVVGFMMRGYTAGCGELCQYPLAGRFCVDCVEAMCFCGATVWLCAWRGGDCDCATGACCPWANQAASMGQGRMVKDSSLPSRSC